MANYLPILVLAAIFLSAELCSAQDEITYLPGLLKQASFKQYSGYLQGTNEKLHYWYVESQNKPAGDPIIVWLYGGPGCSGLYSVVSENGPFTLQPDGVTLEANQYSWNTFANILYLESPAGVGFSYADGSQVNISDDQVINSQYAALMDFFGTKYPTLILNALFVMGEAYAGVYVPNLMLKLHANGSFNLQGMAVGDALTSLEQNDNSIVYKAYYHGLIGENLWQQLQDTCCSNGVCNFHDNSNPDCQNAVSEVSSELFTKGLNPYNLYQDCDGGISTQKKTLLGKYTRSAGQELLFSKFKFSQKNEMKYRYLNPKKVKTELTCLNTSAAETYFNDPYVKQALHVDTSINWEICSSDVSLNYQKQYSDLSDNYTQIMEKFKYRVLLYNGDLDLYWNALGNEWFANSLQLEEQVQRRDWLYRVGSTDQIAGFVKEFVDLAFVTIKGAGHMACRDNGNACQELINNFVHKLPY